MHKSVKITKTEARYATMLALGYTKKEVANNTHRSFGTINKTIQNLYEKLQCRNLADLTRKIISRYAGIDTEELLYRAMHDSLILLVLIAIGAIIMNYGIMNTLIENAKAIFVK